MRLLLLSAADLERALPMRRAVEVTKEAFRAFSAGEAIVPQRLSLPFGRGSGTLLVKPGALPGRALGAKVAAVVPRNAERGLPATSALMICLSPETGVPEALVEGTALTAWRTGAASGAATDLLAPAGARMLALLGAGGQARAQALGVAAVRPLRELRIFAPTREHAERLAAGLRSELFARPHPGDERDRLPPATLPHEKEVCSVRVVASAREAVEGAEVVCTATTSETPVLEDAWLAPGAHVNGIGSFRPGMRELPPEMLARAAVVVDSRESAGIEAGELVDAVRHGFTDPSRWVELGELVAGAPAPTVPAGGVTLFKSVGLAVQDLAASAAVVHEARRRGFGRFVDL